MAFPSITDLLDILRNASNAEILLRQQANTEWANGIQGPMTEAHKASIANVIKAAQQLTEYHQANVSAETQQQ